MKITVEKVLPVSFIARAASFTCHSGEVSEASVERNLAKWYASEHSPIHTQFFWVEMHDIPSFVSVHLVRHKIGVDHYVQTMRDDRGATTVADRNTPVRHAMLINAQALINMARKRLCCKAHAETRWVMGSIKSCVTSVDPALGNLLVPECEYRGRCVEMKGCGKEATNGH